MVLERRNIKHQPELQLADGSRMQDKVFFELITDAIWEKVRPEK